MEVDVYKASKRPTPQETLYVFVLHGEIPEEKLPPEEIRELGFLERVKTIDLESGQKRIGLNTEEALQSLNEKGYYVQSTHFVIRFTPTASSQSIHESVNRR